MNENKRHPIQTDCSLADSTLLSLNYEANNQFLRVVLELWDEKTIELKMEDVVYFLYQPGDVISEIYENSTSSLEKEKTNEHNSSEFPNHKLIEFCDINDLSFLKVTCNKVYITKQETTTQIIQ